MSWWQDRVVYQIYPRSFQDSNGDGIGDLPGITRRLDELKALGVGILWLSPVYASPDVDNGYDISDYCSINPQFGTLADMDRLIAEASARDIRIIMDLVINHTSNEHEWFKKSCAGDPVYKDYYIWRPANKKGGPPNNWSSFFAEDAWEWNEQRGEYYLHLFTKEQPDLNYENPAVLEEVEKILRFWLDRGVAGFRCDMINVLSKSTLKNGRWQLALRGLEHYLQQEKNHEILRKLRRDVFSRYDCFTVGEAALVTPQQARDLCGEGREELDMVFSFEQHDADQFYVKWFPHRLNARRFFRILSRWQNELSWNANYFENHDQPRSVSRYGNTGKYWAQSAKMLGLLLLSLRGTPFLYQGEEIGMTNFDFASPTELEDIESKNVLRLMEKMGFPARMRWRIMQLRSRDNARTPYQWSDGKNAGFTEGTPWLGINGNYTHINYEAQRGDPFSIWNFYREMIAFRADSTILRLGTFKALETTRHIFAFERALEGEKLTVIVNFSDSNRQVDYRGDVAFSNSSRRIFNGTLFPYEAVILTGATLRED
ncbi:MAG: alpha-glucosidase [Oscillospiraceae bacterium]|nr:alpha-glucosidase [Oscillospiraceae bacterium]